VFDRDADGDGIENDGDSLVGEDPPKGSSREVCPE
jgi:hypothetical protein